MKIDYNDPFTAGQMVGMLVMLSFIEKNNGIKKEVLEELKTECADNASVFLEKPAEDVFLIVNEAVKEMNI